jgi:hypothetical protein
MDMGAEEVVVGLVLPVDAGKQPPIGCPSAFTD